MFRRILASLIVAGTTAGWSALARSAEWLPVLAQGQPAAGSAPQGALPIVSVRNYLWESIVVVLVSIAGLYAVCRTSRRQ